MESSKLDGPAEKCHAKIGVGVPGGNTGGARERPPAGGDPVKVVGIDPRRYVTNATIRALAMQTCETLVAEFVGSLMRTMGLSASDMLTVLQVTCDHLWHTVPRTEAPPG